MNERALQAYLEWLSQQVKHRKNQNFSELFLLMGTKEFVWVVANDDNRIQDALDLRLEYYREIGYKPYITTDLLGEVSVLEILIVLSKHLAFQAGGLANVWAWQLLTNLGLQKMSGHLTRREVDEVDEKLERLIYRTYSRDGLGGFFPLSWPDSDQRKVELWYQMAAYQFEHEDPHDD